MRIIERVLDGVVVVLSERELVLLRSAVELERLLDVEEAEAQEAGRVSEAVESVGEAEEVFEWASDAWERDQER